MDALRVGSLYGWGRIVATSLVFCSTGWSGAGRRSSDVLGETLLALGVGETHIVVDAEPGVPPGQKVSRELLCQEFRQTKQQTPRNGLGQRIFPGIEASTTSHGRGRRGGRRSQAHRHNRGNSSSLRVQSADCNRQSLHCPGKFHRRVRKARLDRDVGLLRVNESRNHGLLFIIL